jgi:hypothetical protein
MFPSSRADAAAHMPSSPRWHGCGRLSPCLTARVSRRSDFGNEASMVSRALVGIRLLFTACDPKPSHADTSRRCHQSETWSKGTHSKAASISPIKTSTARGEASSRGGARSALAPTGCLSVDHFLDSLAELAGRTVGGQADLARYLGAPTESVSRWLGRKKVPL